MNPKLVMINITNHKYPYGTILQVIKERGKIGYVAEVAEQGNRIYIAQAHVRDI